VRGLPLNSRQERFLRFQLGQKDQVVPYTLTNTSTGTFQWKVTGPPSPWALAAGREASLGITTGAAPASGVQLVLVPARGGR